MAKRRTGLGVEAFFPFEEAQERTFEGDTPSAKPPQEKRRSSKPRTPHKRAKPVERITTGRGETCERRPAWIRLDHLERLDALKHRERKRLRREAKRASRSTLIDEAIERYLLEMEK